MIKPSKVMTKARQEMHGRKERDVFQPGRFVMLHHACRTPDGPNPDAGRIGKIIKCDRDSGQTEGRA